MNAKREINTPTQDVVNPATAISLFVIFKTAISEIREAMNANVGQAGLTANDLEQIKVPSGGGIAWAIPGLDGEESVKEVEGIIVGWRDIRAYWSVKMEDSSGNTPPDCHSVDARMGIGKPGGHCQSCSFAQFGSGPKGDGQACKLTRQLFLIRQDNFLPEIVNLPPSSLKAIRQYLLRLAAKGVPYYGVITKIALEKAKNPQGIIYSKAVFTSGGRLTPEHTQQAHEYATMIFPLMKSAPALPMTNNVTDSAAGEVV
jgi:hypothetical protein